MTDHVIIDCDTPAGGGDISPAAADRSASLASRNLGEAAAVVEPPTPEQPPAAAGSDEIVVDEVFDFEISGCGQAHDDEDDTDELAFVRNRRLICSASNDGQVSIHRFGDTGIVLTREEAKTLFAFLNGSWKIWSARRA